MASFVGHGLEHIHLSNQYARLYHHVVLNPWVPWLVWPSIRSRNSMEWSSRTKGNLLMRGWKRSSLPVPYNVQTIVSRLAVFNCLGPWPVRFCHLVSWSELHRSSFIRPAKIENSFRSLEMGASNNVRLVTARQRDTKVLRGPRIENF